MAVIAKVILTVAIFFIAIFLFIVIKNNTGTYSAGVFLLILVAGTFASIITIWLSKPGGIGNKNLHKLDES